MPQATHRKRPVAESDSVVSGAITECPQSKQSLQIHWYCRAAASRFVISTS
jgi:hypothetical protein